MSLRAAPEASIRLGKWAGFFAGPTAWFADQQLVTSVVYARCPDNSTELVIGTGAICALLALAGLLVSWRARSNSIEQAVYAKVDRFIATMSVAISGVSALAIVFASVAGVILQCQR